MIKGKVLKKETWIVKSVEVCNMPRKPKIDKQILEDLEKANTEEDILSNLVKMVKIFEQEHYKQIIYSNPFYKSLIPDIQKEVISELEKLAQSINDEILTIESDLKIVGNKDSEKQLKLIKKDCLSLIYEIDERKKQVQMLSQN